MKSTLLLFTFLFNLFIFGQEKTEPNFDVTKIPNYSYLKTKIDLSDMPANIEKLPEFPEGINAFRTKFTEKVDLFNVKAEQGQTLKTKVYFVIEKDGKISNILAVGDIKYSEAVEKAIKKIKDIWTPALANGEPARFLFSMPLSLMNH